MRRGWPGWLRSAIIAGITLGVAWHAYDFSMAPVLRRTMPDMALQYNPIDPVAIAARVHARSANARKYTYLPEDIADARRSLLATPLSRTSLRIIGLGTALDGKAAEAEAALKLAHRVSRRDALTEAWLLEDAARTNDFAGILRHYNAALSVNPELAPALNPIMIRAMRFSAIRPPLREYVRKNALWTPAFLAQAAKEARLSDLMDVVGQEARFLGDDRYKPAISQVVYRLAAQSQWDKAMALSEAAWPDFDVRNFTRFAPSPASTDDRLGRLAWMLSNGDGIETAWIADGTIEATLEPLARGPITQRVVAVNEAGSYSFIQRIGFPATAEDALAMWQIDCVLRSGEAAQKIWGQAIPAIHSSRTYRAIIQVPADCPLLSFRLEGRGSDGDRTVRLLLSELDFARSR